MEHSLAKGFRKIWVILTWQEALAMILAIGVRIRGFVGIIRICTLLDGASATQACFGGDMLLRKRYHPRRSYSKLAVNAKIPNASSVPPAQGTSTCAQEVLTFYPLDWKTAQQIWLFAINSHTWKPRHLECRPALNRKMAPQLTQAMAIKPHANWLETW